MRVVIVYLLWLSSGKFSYKPLMLPILYFSPIIKSTCPYFRISMHSDVRTTPIVPEYPHAKFTAVFSYIRLAIQCLIISWQVGHAPWILPTLIVHNTHYLYRNIEIYDCYNTESGLTLDRHLHHYVSHLSLISLPDSFFLQACLADTPTVMK